MCHRGGAPLAPASACAQEFFCPKRNILREPRATRAPRTTNAMVRLMHRAHATVPFNEEETTDEPLATNRARTGARDDDVRGGAGIRRQQFRSARDRHVDHDEGEV